MAPCALAGGGRQRLSKRHGPSTKRSAGAAFWVPLGVVLPARASPPFETAVKKPSDPQSRLRERAENSPEDFDDSDGSSDKEGDGSESSDIEEIQSTQPRGAVMILARFSAAGSLNWLLGRPRPRVARGKGSRPRPCSSRGEGSRPRWRPSRGETPKIRSQMKLHFKAWLQSALTRPRHRCGAGSSDAP